MQRYVAFAWNNELAERTLLAEVLAKRLMSAPRDWTCAMATPGLYVYHSGGGPGSAHVLTKNLGIVLGTLFERNIVGDGNPRMVALTSQEAQNIERTQGRHLIDHYWGRYVALLRENGSQRIRVLRDPTGAMPCLLTTFRGIDVICSHIVECAAFGLNRYTVNWEHVAAFLWFRRFASSQTGLVDVRQVQAGECVTIASKSTTATFYWHPVQICEARLISTQEEALQEIRRTIHFCVGAWSSRYGLVLHELSGGIDSAIVLACLSEASNTKVVCQNFYTRTAEGDERVFARAAASNAQVELIETPLCPSSRPLHSILDSAKPASPLHTILVPEYQPARERMLAGRGVEAVFSGQGGDHLFQQMKTPLIAAEYAWRNGLLPGIVPVVADTSRLTRKSAWSVMATAVCGLLHRRADYYEPMLEPPLLLNEKSWRAVDLRMLRHPWVEDAEHLPGAKVLQIMDVICSQSLSHLPSQYADVVHPLISQPIIELCLQIPSYVLTYGGIDRALVRDAFGPSLPPTIANRTTKGGTSNYAVGTLIANLPPLRRFLLDGLLVQKGLLDSVKVQSCATEASLLRNPYLLFPLLSAIQAEAWLKAWYSNGTTAVI